MDLIYIDGGHSYDVVKSDWINAKKLMHKHTVVVFHDYGIEEGVTRTVKEIDPKKYDITVKRICWVKAK